MKMTKKNCFYFDSFGVGIVNENIRKFVFIFDKEIYSDLCIQDIRSQNFGMYCIAFVKFVNCVSDYNRFINLFDNCDLLITD